MLTAVVEALVIVIAVEVMFEFEFKSQALKCSLHSILTFHDLPIDFLRVSSVVRRVPPGCLLK